MTQFDMLHGEGVGWVSKRVKYMHFTLLTLRIMWQAKRSNGFVAMRVRPRGLRTLSVWADEESMRGFRNSGIHAVAMKMSRSFGINRSATWAVDKVPSWRDALRRLSAKEKK